MANGTLSTKFELLSGLADNNAKEITASDVQNIVKSNYQPVMIWSGIFVRMNNTNKWVPRTLYYNPDFFKPRGTGTSVDDFDQIWRFKNRGTLAANTTYENVQVVPNAYDMTESEFAQLYPTQPATFNIRTNGVGAVESYDIITCGQGWYGASGLLESGGWEYPGQTGTLAITGFTDRPEVEFVGPLTPTVATASDSFSPAWNLSTNENEPTDPIPGQGDNHDHTFLNTQVLHSICTGKNQGTFNSGWWMGPSVADHNTTGLYINQLSSHGIVSNGYETPNSVSLWRMPF